MMPEFSTAEWNGLLVCVECKLNELKQLGDDPRLSKSSDQAAEISFLKIIRVKIFNYLNNQNALDFR